MFLFRIRLALKTVGEDRLEYGIAPGFRILFFLISGVIIFSLFYTQTEGLFRPPNLIPIVLTLLCLIAALYNERWIFDRTGNTVVQQTGLIMIYRSKRLKLEALRAIELSGFRMGEVAKSGKGGLFNRTLVTLALHDTDGKIHKLDIVKAVHLKEIRLAAQQLADFCGIPLEDKAGDPA